MLNMLGLLVIEMVYRVGYCYFQSGIKNLWRRTSSPGGGIPLLMSSSGRAYPPPNEDSVFPQARITSWGGGYPFLKEDIKNVLLQVRISSSERGCPPPGNDVLLQARMSSSRDSLYRTDFSIMSYFRYFTATDQAMPHHQHVYKVDYHINKK